MKTVYIIGAAFTGDSPTTERIASVDTSGTVRFYIALSAMNYAKNARRTRRLKS